MKIEASEHVRFRCKLFDLILSCVFYLLFEVMNKNWNIYTIFFIYSNVVEKCVSHASRPDRAALIDEVCSDAYVSSSSFTMPHCIYLLLLFLIHYLTTNPEMDAIHELTKEQF